METIQVNDVVKELIEVKRPKKGQIVKVESLGNRTFPDAKTIKALFNMFKKQKINTVGVDFSNNSQIVIELGMFGLSGRYTLIALEEK